MTQVLITTAKQIVDLGVEDPDLFVAMALFEEGFGPDRISDMTANVIMRDLLRFNERVLSGLPVPRNVVTLRLRNGTSYQAELPINPFVRTETPIVLTTWLLLRLATRSTASRSTRKSLISGKLAVGMTRMTYEDGH
jgi:hypothetical protein